MLLLNFCSHIEMVAKSVRKMYDEWERTYPGKHTQRLERFGIDTQETLIGNWKKLLSHLDEAKGRLDGRIQKSVDELRMIREGVG